MTNPGTNFNNPFGNSRIVLSLLFFVLFVSVYIFLKIYIYAPSPNTVSYKNNNFYVYGLNIPSKLDFCGEKIPSNDSGIKKDLEKEFFNDDYWKAHSRVLFDRAQRWFPVIEPILKEEGVPDDFKYLAVIESHLSNVSSPAGASGFWQLVPASAYNYGLEVNGFIDERYNVEKSTHAACRHIKDAYRVFNNWTLSAAAYNRGIGGILSALKTQKTDNYFDLMLNSETGSFVYRILAFKTLLSSPSHFGINKKLKKGQRGNFKVLKFDTSVTNLSHFAKHFGTTAQIIRQFNPWILGSGIVNPAKKTYELKLPKNNRSDYSGYISDLNGGLQVTDTPFPEAPSTAAAGDTSQLQKKTIYYVVKVDEPLQTLADFFKIKLEDLRRWNNLAENQNATKGQTLTIYYYPRQNP